MSPALFARNLLPAVEAALADTRVVAIQGARQVGKSTLARVLAEDRSASELVTLDDDATREAARADPRGFVSQRPGLLVIDEVQRVPELMLAIKAEVDRDARPGRFLLTGSSRLLATRGLADTLAGRIELLELGPLTQGEIEGDREHFVDALMSASIDVTFTSELCKEDYLHRALTGGFPEAQRRDETRRAAWFDSYVTTVAERESAAVADLARPGDLARLLHLVAARHAGVLNVAALARDAGMPERSTARYLAVLEAVYLVRRISSWSTNLTSKVARAPKLLVADSGLAAHLRGADVGMLSRPELAHGADGPLLEGFAILELVRQRAWSRARPAITHFRDRDGVEVDVVLETRDGRVAGVEVKATHTVREADFRGLRLLRDRLGDQFVAGVLLHPGQVCRSFGDRLTSMPLAALWQPTT